MIKSKIVKILLKSIIVIAILNLNSFSFAEDSCSDSSVESGLPLILQDYNYSEDWFSTLYLNTNKETIPRNDFTEAWVDSGEWGCPPYRWTVDGSGFHFESKSGPISISTYKESETPRIWSDNTACGTATITVTDVCGQVATAYVRNTYGEWVTDCDKSSSTGFGTCGVSTFFVKGSYRYQEICACFETGDKDLCGANHRWWCGNGKYLRRAIRQRWQCE
jgi:hypothetical protein